MRVRVLGCSGAIAQGCKTTSFLVDEDILIDAGTGVGDLSRDEMLRIDDLFLTHSHLDHIACLPLMVDTIASARLHRPLRVHALAPTLNALRQHVFNDLIWPDFTKLPTQDAPLLTFHALDTGTVRHLKGRAVEALPAVHTVPTVGYAVRGPQSDAPWWVYSGDTEGGAAFWARVNQLNVHSLVIETAFSNRERELARMSRHLSPDALGQQLEQRAPGRHYPVYISHTKPSETESIMREVTRIGAPPSAPSGGQPNAGAGPQPHAQGQAPGDAPLDIRPLYAGHQFDL